MEERIIEILLEACGAEPGDIGDGDNLFEEGMLDSFGVLSLLVTLEEELGVELPPAVITRQDIETPAKLVQTVLRQVK